MVLRFFIFAVFLFMSCADGERDNPYDPGSENYEPWGSSSSEPSCSSSAVASSSSSSNSAAKEYDYCVFVSEKICLKGPLTSCPTGGTLSNSCPYGSSSSVAAPPSSSSARQSSSSSKPSSSSVVPSSSSIPPPPPPSSSSVAPSSSSAPTQSGVPGPSVTDGGGNTYKTVIIGSQTWMASNLNYAAPGSKCGNGSSLSDANTATCDTYGRLYNWATAMALDANCNSSSCSEQIKAKHQGICPSGWHIPSDAEWTTLTNFVGSSAGTKLKANSPLWNSNGKGTDNFGFAALPGGYGNSGGSFFYVGLYGFWWSATEDNASSAYYRVMNYDDEFVGRVSNYKSNYLFSVRCLQD